MPVAGAAPSIVCTSAPLPAVDADLLGQRQVHGEMKEGVGPPFLDVVLRCHGHVDVSQVTVVLGVLRDPVGRLGLERGQRLTGPVLLPGLAEKSTDLFLTRGEHG
mgnify:CR=1 FL=1